MTNGKEKYIATFYAHFGAIRFNRNLLKRGIRGKVMPVPRNLSSSCGTCVCFETDGWMPGDTHGEIEQIVKVSETGYICVYQAENS